MRCAYCKTENQDGASVCSVCGKPLIRNYEVNQNTEPEQNSMYGQTQGQSQMYGQNQGQNSMYGQAQGQDQMYGQTQGQNSMYGQNQGQNSMYGQAQGQNSMYGQNQGQNSMYGQVQGQNSMYRQNQGQNSMYGQTQGQSQMYGQNPGLGKNMAYGFNPVAMQTQELSMKWYKFIIYVALFLSCALNVGNAIMYFTGIAYTKSGVDASIVYAYFSGLKTIDYAYAVVLLFMAAGAIFVRQRLAHFCSNGPTLLYILIIVNLVSTFLYIIGLSVVTGENALSSNIAGNLGGSIVALGVNITYFSKRKYLFVNK